MNIKYVIAPTILTLLVLESCASQPYAPTVAVMPGRHKSFDEFQRDDYDCRGFAGDRVAGRAEEANKKALTSGIIGTALGAGLGAAVGGGKGAAIGAAGGAVAGTAVGTNGFSQPTLQGQYDIAYTQCMVAHGHRAPDYRDNYPPPPPPPPRGY